MRQPLFSLKEKPVRALRILSKVVVHRRAENGLLSAGCRCRRAQPEFWEKKWVLLLAMKECFGSFADAPAAGGILKGWNPLWGGAEGEADLRGAGAEPLPGESKGAWPLWRGVQGGRAPRRGAPGANGTCAVRGGGAILRA